VPGTAIIIIIIIIIITPSVAPSAVAFQLDVFLLQMQFVNVQLFLVMFECKKP
jgi:hypothetical protein